MKKKKKNQPAKTETRQEAPAPVAEREVTESSGSDLVGGAAKGALVGGLVGGGGGAAAGGAAGLIGGVLGDDDDESGW
ncbi:MULTISPECIES: hypothetical protein [Sorangium]|uniref:Glycine zipper domain-containing protein n=1 Tax=Sorangium cellulosum TaxID=56 RepID=A0A4P2QVC9_SORCE|nr:MULTISPECIES: hypothetical protein [Sorangium]AUX34315.1 uncharacterized protein SOCE836_064870 [Sorangium cellulosum]WCQ93633.1 hypothetical protein NQZ70_06385 [Sorangium sp. Soce836]